MVKLGSVQEIWLLSVGGALRLFVGYVPVILRIAFCAGFVLT